MSEQKRKPDDDSVESGIAEGLWDDALADAFGSDAPAGATEVDEPPSVLLRLENRLGKAPDCVHLADDLLDDDSTAIIDPHSTQVTEPGRRVGRYLLLGEIARGGMGVVLHGRDIDLGRDVAIKVLQDKYADQTAMVQRFIEEAQVAGQLQHPGVIPVYEIGLDASRRPFFSMKLVRGRTLSALLHERAEPDVDLSRFLHIYEQVCQTLAYSHARGVVHRDVKPANIMVGAFGEVQVMDWGMAKVLSRGGVDDEELDEDPATRIETVRSDGRGSQSLAGSVLGTPAYMPPEQAQGHVMLIDERADVFALGGILCEILTGHPPYVRQQGSSPIQQAQAASLDDALRRLDACEADHELIALAKKCLLPDMRARPRDAAVVARKVGAYRVGAERRAEEARIEARAARVRVQAERKARRLTLALAAAALAVIVLVGGGLWWLDSARRAERSRNDRQVVAAINEADSHMGARRWDAAAASLRGVRRVVANGRVSSGVADDLNAADRRLRTGRVVDQQRVTRDARDAAFVARLREIRNQPVIDPASSDDEYAAAFEYRGLDVDIDSASRVASVIRGAEGEVAEALTFALDDWAGRRRLMADDERWRRLVQIARLADDDAWRSGLRDALLDNELGRLKTLAKDVDVTAQHPGSLTLLAMSLDRASEREVALSLLRRACDAHPRDYWVHQRLAVVLVGEFKIEDGRRVRHESSSQEDLEEAAVHLQVALVLQPDSTFNMAFFGTVMHRRGDKVGALAYLDGRLGRYADDAALKGARAQVMFEEDPDAAVAGLRGVRSGPFGRQVLERARLMGLGLPKHPEAEIKRLRAVIGADPKDGRAHTDLARLLLQVGDLERAADYALEATGLRGDRPEAWQLFARALLERGLFAQAVEAFRGAQALRGLRGFNIELERKSRLFSDREREFERQRLTGADPMRLEVRMDLARYCAFSGHSARAATLFKEVVAAWSPGGSRRPLAGPRGRPRAPMEILFEAGLVAVLSEDFKFARVCLERNLKADERRPGGGRERRMHSPSALQLHRWRHDRRLAPIRSPEALGDMSDAVRRVWEDLWHKVDKHLSAPR